MAVKAERVSVATSATLLDRTDTIRRGSLLVRNRGSAAVYLGASDVSTSTGFQLDAGESVSVDAETYPVGLYAVCASGTVSCHVLQVGS